MAHRRKGNARVIIRESPTKGLSGAEKQIMSETGCTTHTYVKKQNGPKPAGTRAARRKGRKGAGK